MSLSLAAPPLHADPIALATGSTINASVSVPETDPTTTADVTSLPYATSTSESESGQSSIVTPALTTGEFSFAFSQTVTAALMASIASPGIVSDSDTADGNGDLFFTAGPNTQYAITGSLASSTSDDQLYAYLQDTTTGAAPIYSYSNSGGPALTLDSTGGPLTGPLTAGNTYEFYADENSSASGQIVSDLTFTQAVPEPAMGIIVLAGAAVAKRSRRRSFRPAVAV
jgi:hypothetical protein